MDTGIKLKIWQELSRRGYMSHEEIIAFARKDRFYKEATLERRLRMSESPNVRPEMGRRGDGGEYIKGYSWIASAPYKVETKDDKKRREAREREDKMLALAREGKLAF